MNEFWSWFGSIPWFAWIPILAILSACPIVALSLGHARTKRELLHAERIRAIEAGLPWQEPEQESAKSGAKFMHNAFWISFWLVFTVPGAAFSGASSGTKYVDHLAIAIAAWSAAGLASIAAVGCATKARTRSFWSAIRATPRSAICSRRPPRDRAAQLHAGWAAARAIRR